MKKPVVDPNAPRKVKGDFSYAMFEPNDILRSSKGGYVRVLETLEVSDGDQLFVELTVEPCERPLSGLYVVGVLRE